MPAPEQPQPPTELRSEPSEERPPSISTSTSISTSMRDLLASCAAADAVSKPPAAPEAQGDGEQDAA